MSAAAAAEKEEILGGHSEREKESEQLREGERQERDRRLKGSTEKAGIGASGERGGERRRMVEHKHGSVEWDGMGTSFAFVPSVRSAHFREKNPFSAAANKE